VRTAVVSFSHELLVELFRTRGELAPTLLRLCKGIAFDHERAEQRSIDLSQVVSTEYRADAVVVLHDHRDAIVAAVIVEVQLNIDRDKERTWPVYVAALHHKLACPVILVVVTPSQTVARWASRPIHLGHPGLALEPVVIELASVPRVTDPAQVHAVPELGVLSTMAHPDIEVATTALSAVSLLPEDRAQLYLDVILAALPRAVGKELEAQMRGYVYQSEFARKYYSQGLEEGRSLGVQEGRSLGVQEGRSLGVQEGRSLGQAGGLRSAVLALIRTKVGVVTGDDEAAVAAMRDERVLIDLIEALGRATGGAEIRAALAAAAAAAHSGA
jgi:hypothetical protein